VVFGLSKIDKSILNFCDNVLLRDKHASNFAYHTTTYAFETLNL
jgi:hypothetical protein